MSGSTSYRVSARLQIEGDAERTLQRVARALTSLDQGIVRTERNIRSLMRALNGMGGAGADVRRAAAAMDQLRAGSQGAGQAVRGTTASINAQARALDRAAQAAQNATAAMRGLGAANPGRIGGGGGGGGGYHSRLGEAAALGAGGHAAMRGLGNTLVEAGAAQQAGTIMRASGVTPAERAQAEARAWEMTELVRGTTMAENLQLIGQLRTTFGSIEDAMRFAPQMQQVAMTLSGVTGRDPGRQGQMAARFLDAIDAFNNPETGTIDPARGMALARMMQNAIILNQGTVTPEEMLNFAKQARLSARRLDPGFMFGVAPTLIEQMGGHRTGTEMAAVYRQVVTGTMTQRVADQMIRYGLLREEDREVRRGGQVVVRPGSVAGAQLYANNPLQWVQQILLPALASRGVTGFDQQIEAISSMFGTETARGFIGQMIASMPQLMRGLEMYQQMPGNAPETVSEGWNTTLRNLGAAFTNVMTAVGSAVMDDAIMLMNALAGGLNRLASVFRDYPGVADALFYLAAGLGALMTAGGLYAAGMLAMTGITALTGGLGMAGLAGVLIAIAPYVGILTGVGIALKALYDAVPGDTLAEKLNNAAAALRNLYEAVTGFLDRIGAAWQRGEEARRQLDESGPALGQGGSRFRRNRDEMLRNYYGDEAPDAVPQNFNPAPPRGGAAPTPIILQMDGREIGRGILPHVGRAAGGPIQAPARFDGRRIYTT